MDKQTVLKRLMEFDPEIALIVSDLYRERDEYEHAYKVSRVSVEENRDRANTWMRLYVGLKEQRESVR